MAHAAMFLTSMCETWIEFLAPGFCFSSVLTIMSHLRSEPTGESDSLSLSLCLSLSIIAEFTYQIASQNNTKRIQQHQIEAGAFFQHVNIQNACNQPRKHLFISLTERCSRPVSSIMPVGGISLLLFVVSPISLAAVP